MKVYVSILVFLAVLLLPATAADFELTYLEGTLEVESGSGLRTATVGNRIPLGSTVHLAENSIAELASGSVTLLLSEKGTYELEPLAEQKQRVRKSIGESIFRKLAKIGGQDGEIRSEAMGTRGAEAVGEDSMEWVDEDNLAYDEAIAAYEKESYDRAAEILEEQVDPLMIEDATAYWFYLASSLLNTGRGAEALKIASGFCGSRSSSMYEEYLFLRARLYLEALDFEAAAQLFKSYIDLASTAADRQIGLYMYGYSLLQIGDREGARVQLKAAAGIEADPDIRSAARMLLD